MAQLAPRLVGAWLLAMLLILPYLWTSHFLPDEFVMANDAKMVAAGGVQGRDFFEFLMPGNALALGAVYKLFGPSLLAARLWQGALVAVTAVAYWRLAKAAGAGRWLAFFPAAMLVLVMMGQYYYYGHRWFSQAGVALTLVGVWWALAKPDPWRWAVVGVAAGLTYIMQQLDGAALLGALGLGLSWVAWRQGWGWAGYFRAAACGLAGWLAPLLLLSGYFALYGQLREVLWETHVWPIVRYRAAGNPNDVMFLSDLPALLGTGGDWVSRPYWYTNMVVLLAGGFVPLAVVPAALAGFAGRQGPVPPDRREALLGFVTFMALMAFLASLRGRADVIHVMAVSLPCYVLLAVAATSWEAHTAAARWALGFRWVPRAAFAALILAGGVRFAELARHDPAGWLSLESPDARIVRHPTFAAVARHLKPGDTILVSDIGSLFNFYTAPGPTRYNLWMRPEAGYTMADQFDEIRADVARRRTRLILVTAEDQQRADYLIQEFLPTYHLVEVLEHPLWAGRPGQSLHVYTRNPD